MDMSFADKTVQHWFPFIKRGNLSTLEALDLCRDFNRSSQAEIMEILDKQVQKQKLGFFF